MGFDSGDEYLTLLSEALKKYSDNFFEVYNYTSNSFCFIFKEENGDGTEKSFAAAQNIQDIMERNYMVANISIRQTATGCFFHVSADDSPRIDDLLKNAETAMRQAKMQGGNTLIKM